MPALSRRPTSEPRACLREQITSATRTALEEGTPYADLTVEAITQRVGISRSAFYDHFSDKRQLLLHLIEEMMRPVFTKVGEYLRTAPTAPETRRATIRTALALVLDLCREGRPVLLAADEAATYDAEVGAAWQRLLRDLQAAVQRRIEGQQSVGTARHISAGPVAFTLVTMVGASFVRHLRHPGQLTDDELLDAVASVWGGALYDL